jgi:hypothetical protein
MSVYQDIGEFAEALDNGYIDEDALNTYCCKGSLYVKDASGDTLFERDYGSQEACDDVCQLLGLFPPESV